VARFFIEAMTHYDTRSCHKIGLYGCNELIYAVVSVMYGSTLPLLR